jgi:hypothetical protein
VARYGAAPSDPTGRLLNKIELKVIQMRTLILAALAICAPMSAQDTHVSKPKISVKLVVPDAVPRGTCTQDEAGYLETYDGHNHYKPYGSVELGTYLADRTQKGFVVTVYPQPNGRLWVDATCGIKAEE